MKLATAGVAENNAPTGTVFDDVRTPCTRAPNVFSCTVQEVFINLALSLAGVFKSHFVAVKVWGEPSLLDVGLGAERVRPIRYYVCPLMRFRLAYGMCGVLQDIVDMTDSDRRFDSAKIFAEILLKSFTKRLKNLVPSAGPELSSPLTEVC